MQYYAIASSQEVPKQFDLILRSGTEYSFPYSLLPIYRLTGNKEIAIISYGLRITIKGRNLKGVRNSLKRETVIWIKESPSQKDDEQSDVYVSEINITGDALEE